MVPRRLPGPHQDRRFDASLAGGEPHHVAIDEAEIAARRLRRQVQRIAPDLFGERLRAFLQPGIVGHAAVAHRGIGRERQGETVGRAGRRDLRQLRRRRRNFRRSAVGDDAVLQRLPPPAVEIAGRAGCALPLARARDRTARPRAAPPSKASSSCAVRVS